MRNKKTIDRKMLALENIENLMLIVVLGEEPYRSQAQRELYRRCRVTDFQHIRDCVRTNLSVAC